MINNYEKYKNGSWHLFKFSILNFPYLLKEGESIVFRYLSSGQAFQIFSPFGGIPLKAGHLPFPSYALGCAVQHLLNQN
jgi:hypothetical protein